MSRLWSKIVLYDLLVLFGLALVIRLLAALPQQQPDYMDEAYSYVNALNLAAGRGFVEDFVWNYLGRPGRPPQPSHLYWMPLTSILAWLGMAVGGTSYRAAQVPFILLSALLAPLAYLPAYTWLGRRWPAWLAGLLAIFSGFYFPFWTAIDNFTPFAVAGALALWLAYGAGEQSQREAPRGSRGAGERASGSADQRASELIHHLQFIIHHPQFLFLLASGLCIGLAHLARADGPLLLVAIWLWSLTAVEPRTTHHAPRTSAQPPFGTHHVSRFTFHVSRFTFHALRLLLPLLGYLLIMAPWFIRNWQVAGTPLPAAGSSTIWLPTGTDLFNSYSYLFSYRRELSAASFLAQGLGPIMQGRWWVLQANAQQVLASWGMIFLAPLALVGAWQRRSDRLMQLAGLYGLLLFLVMTLVFAFPGALGGLFHSGAALLPFIYAAAVTGLEGGIEWVAARRRRWDRRLAKKVFGLGLVLLAVLLSSFIYYRRVLAGGGWNHPNSLYPAVAAWVAEQQPGATVMINDPPSYRYYGGGLSVVVPAEELETTLEVAQAYGVDYLILERNHPAELSQVYTGTFTHPGLSLVKTFNPGGDPVYVFKIEGP